MVIRLLMMMLIIIMVNNDNHHNETVWKLNITLRVKGNELYPLYIGKDLVGDTTVSEMKLVVVYFLRQTLMMDRFLMCCHVCL